MNKDVMYVHLITFRLLNILDICVTFERGDINPHLSPAENQKICGPSKHKAHKLRTRLVVTKM